MRESQSSLNRAVRPLVLSLIPVLTCTTASAQSLYPDGSTHYSNRIGSSGYAVPSYTGRGAVCARRANPHRRGLVEIARPFLGCCSHPFAVWAWRTLSFSGASDALFGFDAVEQRGAGFGEFLDRIDELVAVLFVERDR